jgi:hypothetical protein
MMTFMGKRHRRHGKGRDQSESRENAREPFRKHHGSSLPQARLPPKQFWMIAGKSHASADLAVCLQQKMQYAAAAEAARTPIANRAYMGPLEYITVTPSRKGRIHADRLCGSAGGHANITHFPRLFAVLMRVSRAGRPVHHSQHCGATSLQKAPNKVRGEYEEGDIEPGRVVPYHRCLNDLCCVLRWDEADDDRIGMLVCCTAYVG